MTIRRDLIILARVFLVRAYEEVLIKVRDGLAVSAILM